MAAEKIVQPKPRDCLDLPLIDPNIFHFLPQTYLVLHVTSDMEIEDRNFFPSRNNQNAALGPQWAGFNTINEYHGHYFSFRAQHL